MLAGLSPALLTYLVHTEGGVGFRALARKLDCPPSTVLRQVRRVEDRRDDPLFDTAMRRLADSVSAKLNDTTASEDWVDMISRARKAPQETDQKVGREARRILRRLCETDAFLAVADGMERAVVLRETVPGRPTRTAVVDRDIAYRFAMNDWVTCTSSGKINRYGITEAGRNALKRFLEEDRQARARQTGYAEQATPFLAQHQEPAEKRVMAGDGSGEKRIRYNLAESPLTVLGRKRDRNGVPYLSAPLVEAGERLREDFEIAQMGPRITQNWDHFLTPAGGGAADSGLPTSNSAQGARDRVHGALSALGPGLSDVAFRVCCFLEGLETAEKRLGWSARSGKVVLRIALQRLALHYGIRGATGAEGLLEQTPRQATVASA